MQRLVHEHSPPGIRFTVKLFAILKDRAGVSEFPCDFPVGTTVAQAAHGAGKSYPAIESLLARVAYAVNQEFVDGDTVLQDGDELALIPPVSGGTDG